MNLLLFLCFHVPDNLDDLFLLFSCMFFCEHIYISEVESFSQSMSSASSLSYTAGIADFDSINNFEKGTQESGNESSLEKARKAIVDAKNSLQIIVEFLSSEK